MSWVSSLVRNISKHTTDKVFGTTNADTTATATATAPPPAPEAAASDATATAATAAATPKLSAAEEVEKLRAENAQLKHTFRVIKLKLDKSGKETATASGAGTPAATASAHTNQEIKDLIARIIATENGKRQSATPTAAPGTAATATAASAAISGTAPPATAAASTAAAGTAAGETVDPFASAQSEKYGTASMMSAASAVDSKSGATATAGTATAAAAGAATATPTAIFYGEDAYATKEEAEKQSGVNLLCYGQLASKDGKEVFARDPRFASAVFASSTLGEDEEEVLVMDLDDSKATTDVDGDASWWAVVENPNPSASRANAKAQAKQDERDKFKEEPALYLDTPQGTATDGFALLEDEDVVGAISDFSAQCVRRFRGAKQLDPNQMQQLLQTTFATVEPPSKLGRIIQWGQLAYSGYGWASSAYYLYRQPALIRGTYSVVKWLLVLVL